jgi:hypothetical protein
MVDIRANYVDISRLASDVLGGSQQLADGWRTAKLDLLPAAAVFGDSKAGASLADAHTGVVEEAGTTIGRLVTVLEDDVDRLYRVAFAYEKQEADAQEDLYKSGQGGQSLRGAP